MIRTSSIRALLCAFTLSLVSPLAALSDWTVVDIPGNLPTPLDMVYYNGLFIAVGYDGEVITSPDGQNWSLHVLDVDPDDLGGSWALTNLAASDTLVAAVGQGGIIVISRNGIDWEVIEKASSSGNSYSDIAYGNGMFILTTGSDEVIHTSDFETFTSSVVANGVSTSGIVYMDEQFLVTTGYDKVVYVGDGVSWDEMTSYLPDFSSFSALDFVNNAVYVGGVIDGSQAVAVATSQDGFSLSTMSEPELTGFIKDFAGDGSIVAAVGGNFYNPKYGYVLVSMDNGVSFSVDTDEFEDVPTAIAQHDGLWVVVGNDFAAYNNNLSPESTPYLVQGADDYGGGWYGTWQGDINVTQWPWVYSGIGWYYAGTAGNTNAGGWYFMTVAELNCWLYTGESNFPWVYCTPAGQAEGWWYADTEQDDYTYFFSGSSSAVVAVPDAF